MNTNHAKRENVQMAKVNVRCHNGKIAKAKRFHTTAGIKECAARGVEEPKKPYQHSVSRQSEIDAHNRAVHRNGMFAK